MVKRHRDMFKKAQSTWSANILVYSLIYLKIISELYNQNKQGHIWRQKIEIAKIRDLCDIYGDTENNHMHMSFSKEGVLQGRLNCQSMRKVYQS